VTNFGVSLRTLQKVGTYDFNGDGAVDAQDIRGMSEADARIFYYQEFWQAYGYGSLPGTVAIKVFDFSVNMGPHQAHLILQRALMANGHRLKDDGILGPVSRELIEKTLTARLIPAMRSEAAGFYRMLVTRNPPLDKFLKGWLRRAYL